MKIYRVEWKDAENDECIGWTTNKKRAEKLQKEVLEQGDFEMEPIVDELNIELSRAGILNFLNNHCRGDGV